MWPISKTKSWRGPRWHQAPNHRERSGGWTKFRTTYLYIALRIVRYAWIQKNFELGEIPSTHILFKCCKRRAHVISFMVIEWSGHLVFVIYGNYSVMDTPRYKWLTEILWWTRLRKRGEPKYRNRQTKFFFFSRLHVFIIRKIHRYTKLPFRTSSRCKRKSSKCRLDTTLPLLSKIGR